MKYTDLPFGFVVAVIAVVTTASVFAVLRRQASRATTTAGFWYENGSFALPADATARLGGPLTQDEIASIEEISRAELERALSGLRITITQRHDAFWRVEVLQALNGTQVLRRRSPLPNAGESVGLGPLGGVGSVAFEMLALNGIKHAPAGASREAMIASIGRGIGRAAAHEFAHQILGGDAIHNRTDENSYEYFDSNRASQYYGELHWTNAWPLLQQRIGK